MLRNLSRKFVQNRFLSEIYSINSVQYNTLNVSKLNQTLENSLKENVNSSITSSKLCFHKRQFSISSSPNYCENAESGKPSKKFWPIKYDDELNSGFTSIFDFISIWIKCLKIQSSYMPTFDRRHFLEGTIIAIEVIIQISTLM